MENQKKDQQTSIDFGSIAALNSTVSAFVEDRIQNSHLKWIAKDAAVKHCKSVTRKEISEKLIKSLRKVDERKEAPEASGSGKSLVADYSSDDDSD
jgi:uncharacterized membrane protein YheB (UPF0754 family)